jgi:hypothetical protein
MSSRGAPPPPDLVTHQERWVRLAGHLGLAVLLLLAVPLFLCMPVWSDVTHYDLGAWILMRGGVYYRDLSDFNLPGMVWIHVGLRSLLGWRSEALRLVDLLVVTGNVWLLVRWLRLLGTGPATRSWATILLFFFYFATSEWTHCQRDTWMLLPCLLALELRRRQVERLGGGPPLPAAGSWALLEGLCWGGAVWIKPVVVFPALACWLASAVWIGRAGGPRRVAAVAADLGGLLLGGLAAGGLGCAWLQASGTWPYLMDTLLHANRGYYADLEQFPLHERCRQMVTMLCPWGLLYLLTVPAAGLALVRGLRSAPAGFPDLTPQRSLALVLFAAFFVGWLFQTTFVQKHHEYVLAPGILLSLTLAVGSNWLSRLGLLRAVPLLAVVGVALVHHPLLCQDRLALWGRCWAEGGSPDLKNRLTLMDPQFAPDWVNLRRVEDFLRREGVQDRELVCFNSSSMPLYRELQSLPPTRVPHFDHVPRTHFFLEPVRQELNSAPTRFVVSDLVCLRHPSEADDSAEDANELSLPSWVPRRWAETYPWCEPVVFRAGRYRVHRVTGPIRELKGSMASFYEKPDAEENERAGGPEPLAPRTP